jgi:hypothetical protein
MDRHLACISAAAKGEPGWPPLALARPEAHNAAVAHNLRRRLTLLHAAAA